MGRWRWVDEDEDGDGSMKIRDGSAKDKDKGWVGGGRGQGMGRRRTRTRDGSAKWLACDGGAMCRGVVLGITAEDGFEQGRRSDWRGCAWVLQVECA